MKKIHNFFILVVFCPLFVLLVNSAVFAVLPSAQEDRRPGMSLLTPFSGRSNVAPNSSYTGSSPLSSSAFRDEGSSGIKALMDTGLDTRLVQEERCSALFKLYSSRVDFSSFSGEEKLWLASASFSMSRDTSLDMQSRSQYPGLGMTVLAVTDPTVEYESKAGIVDELQQIAGTSREPEIKISAVRALAGIAQNPGTPAELASIAKDWVKSNAMTDDAKDLFDAYGVMVIGTRGPNERERAELKAFLGVIPKQYRPGVISYEGKEGVQYLGGDRRDIFTGAIVLMNNKDSKIGLLFHETTHDLEGTGALTADMLAERDRLWNISSKSDPLQDSDFVRQYGMTNEQEDIATMVESYGVDSIGLITEAETRAIDGRSEIFLSKVALTADIFSHTKTLSDGREMRVTYVFKHKDGCLIRQEVPLVERTVAGKTYKLPDFSTVYENIAFPAA